MYKIGADPEVFVTHPDFGFVSPAGMIPGDKDNPHPVRLGAVQVDGMALEFNIEPAETRRDFIRNVNAVFGELQTMLSANQPEMSIQIVSTARFSPMQYYSTPAENLVIGCEPDYNAYTGVANPAPQFRTDTTRQAAGHIHVGYTEGADPFDPEHFNDCCERVKYLDMYMSQMWDEVDPRGAERRNEGYGRPGAFRPKPYGFEYRTPSNFWLSSDTWAGWMFDRVMLCMENYDRGVPIELLIATLTEEVA